MTSEFMFKHVADLEKETMALYIEQQLKLIKIAGMSRSQWLDYVEQQCFPNAAKPAPKLYRPPLPTSLRNRPSAPYEVKTLNLKQKGQPGYEREQVELDRLWRAERRAKGHPE